MAVCHFCVSRTMKIWQESFVYARVLALARRGSLRRKNPNVFAHGTPRCSSSPWRLAAAQEPRVYVVAAARRGSLRRKDGCATCLSGAAL